MLNIDQCIDDPTEALSFAARIALAAQGLSLPTVCFTGKANLCTNYIDLNVTIGATTARVASGDGTDASLGPWIELPEEIFPGDFCDEPQIRLREAVLATSGIKACLDLKLSCLPVDLAVPCLDVGDGTDSCEATEKCECVQHPECGWCAATARCTRMVPLLEGFSTTAPVCTCAANSIVTATTDPDGECAPSQPPPQPPFAPPAAPSPPALPPAFPPWVEPAWLNGLSTGPGKAALPFFAQWLVFGLCTGGTLLGIVLCLLSERRTPRRAGRLGPCTTFPLGAFPSSGVSLSPSTGREGRECLPYLLSGSANGGCGGGVGAGADRPDPSASNDVFLSLLPSHIQYDAARAIEVSDQLGTLPEILGLAQPLLLPYAALPLALWLGATVGYIVLLLSIPVPNPLPATPGGMALLLLLLPPAYTVLVRLALRRARGIVYVLTDFGALELSLASSLPLGLCGQEIGRTSYSQMLSVPAAMPRPLWSYLACTPVSDIVFASAASVSRPTVQPGSAGGSSEGGGLGGLSFAPYRSHGPLRFRALSEAARASLIAVLSARASATQQHHQQQHQQQQRQQQQEQQQLQQQQLERSDLLARQLHPPPEVEMAVPRLAALSSLSTSAPQGSSFVDGSGLGPSLTERSDRTSTRERPPSTHERAPPSDRSYVLPGAPTPDGSARERYSGGRVGL